MVDTELSSSSLTRLCYLLSTIEASLIFNFTSNILSVLKLPFGSLIIVSASLLFFPLF